MYHLLVMAALLCFLYNSGASWRHARWRDDRTPRRRGAKPLPPSFRDPCTLRTPPAKGRIVYRQSRRPFQAVLRLRERFSLWPD